MRFPSTSGLSAALSSPEIFFESKHKEIEFANPFRG